MKLKLDLHPIFKDGAQIEAALSSIIDEAIEKRATEVEIIPGKGSGALKKTVLRFLDRPDVKARYHRIEKDSDNFGRLFVHFRHERMASAPSASPSRARQIVPVACVCCQASLRIPYDELPAEIVVECASCGSPNRVVVTLGRSGLPQARADWGYDAVDAGSQSIPEL
ncbi:MAG: Smr/MutS family protein [Capsulimonadaceae bacterium]|nr:Smr/MutS family protein [Capsulimonadaceae bacterium]